MGHLHCKALFLPSSQPKPKPINCNLYIAKGQLHLNIPFGKPPQFLKVPILDDMIGSIDLLQRDHVGDQPTRVDFFERSFHSKTRIQISSCPKLF